jgi:serine/arginine repetitive matrix protein 2
MIGGGHVRRRSVGSAIDASPCVRFGNKRKQPPSEAAQKENQEPGHAVKARIVEKASIASTSSSKFGGERMIKARKGLLERQSLEESALMAEGEDKSISCV